MFDSFNGPDSVKPGTQKHYDRTHGFEAQERPATTASEEQKLEETMRDTKSSFWARTLHRTFGEQVEPAKAKIPEQEEIEKEFEAELAQESEVSMPDVSGGEVVDTELKERMLNEKLQGIKAQLAQLRQNFKETPANHDMKQQLEGEEKSAESELKRLTG